VKHLRWTLVLAAAVALIAVPVAAAKPPGGAVISPAHSAGGLSGGELLGQFWAVQLENPADAFLGGCFSLGKGGKVAVPAPDENFAASCTVKPGTPVYIAPGSECSDVEEPPFFGADEAEQRECAIAFDREFFTAATVSVDGAEPIDFRKRRFEAVSPQVTVELAPDNFLGVPAQTATFVAHAWAFLVRGLTPGEHVISVVVEAVDGVVTEARITIDVLPPGHARL
jgi:hypothetical protein